MPHGPVHHLPLRVQTRQRIGVEQTLCPQRARRHQSSGPLLKTSMRTPGFRRCLSHPSRNGASTRGRWHPNGCGAPVDKSGFIFPRMVQRAVTGRQWEEQYALLRRKRQRFSNRGGGYGLRLSRICLLARSVTPRLVAYSPVRISFRRSGRYVISEKMTVQPSPVGDCASKPIRRCSTLPSVKYRTICQYVPSSE